MFGALLPERFVKSAYKVDYDDLYRRGYRGLIFDIDNTLVPHDAPATARAAMLVRKLRKRGFCVEIVSNNEEPRVKSFAEGVGCDYVYKAGKPKCGGYLEAVRKMGLRREAVMVIGDQLFTDIWGANRSRMHNILVGRISFREPPHIHLKRILEYPLLLAFFAREKKRTKSS